MTYDIDSSIRTNRGHYDLQGLSGVEGWPPFAADFAKFCRTNRAVIEPTALVLQMIGTTLIGSFFFASIGAPIAFVGASLVFFLEEGAPAAAVKTQCKLAAQYAGMGKLAVGLTTVVAPFTGIGIPATPILGAMTALLGTLESVFAALGQGNTPKSADLLKIADIGGAKLSDSLTVVKPFLKSIDDALKLGKAVPFLGDSIKAKEAEVKAAAKNLPIPPITPAGLNLKFKADTIDYAAKKKALEGQLIFQSASPAVKALMLGPAPKAPALPKKPSDGKAGARGGSASGSSVSSTQMVLLAAVAAVAAYLVIK